MFPIYFVKNNVCEKIHYSCGNYYYYYYYQFSSETAGRICRLDQKDKNKIFWIAGSIASAKRFDKSFENVQFSNNHFTNSSDFEMCGK